MFHIRLAHRVAGGLYCKTCGKRGFFSEQVYRYHRKECRRKWLDSIRPRPRIAKTKKRVKTKQKLSTQEHEIVLEEVHVQDMPALVDDTGNC